MHILLFYQTRCFLLFLIIITLNNSKHKGNKLMDRIILHCDMNGFYASVELIDKPHLKNKPMAVCGNPENRHGIILAKNEIAK